MTDTTLDHPAFPELLTHLLWRPRPLVREAGGYEAHVEDFHKESMRQAAEADRDTDEWIQSGKILRGHLWAAFSSGGAEDWIGAAIEAIEKECARNALELKRLEKDFERSRARMRTPGATMIKEFDDWILAIGTKELGERADMALFLRALRAEAGRTGEDAGRIFDDPGQAERYLTRVG